MRNAKAVAVLLVFQLLLLTFVLISQISPGLLGGFSQATMEAGAIVLGSVFMLLSLLLFLFLVTEQHWETAELYLFFTVLAYLFYAVLNVMTDSPLLGLLGTFLLFVMTLIGLLVTQDTAPERGRALRRRRYHRQGSE